MIIRSFINKFTIFLFTVGVIKNKQEYFAKHINSTLAGFGTDDKDMINIIVLRSEMDLGNIEYHD